MKKIVLSFMLVIFLPFVYHAFAQNFSGELGGLVNIKSDVRNRRISTADVTGNNNDNTGRIKKGDKKIIEIPNSGIITHIWITIAPWDIQRNDIIFRIYWDGNSYPSVESPIAAFFGNGWDERYNYASLPLAVTPTDGLSMVSYFMMPFQKGARIEFDNQTDRDIDCMYFYIDYLETKTLSKDVGRFHAWYNHELTNTLPEGETEWGLTGTMKDNKDGAGNYVFANIKGKGHFVGINYYVHSPTTMWYGEGDDMFFIDGETQASLLGTGTEDFFNTSWCPKTKYSHPYFGYPRVNDDIGWLGRTHMYRFFISDPIYFEKSLKGTIEHGHNNNLTLDISSVVYWYQSVASELPDAPTKEERRPKPFINEREIHKWRHEWRKNNGNDLKLWGNE